MSTIKAGTTTTTAFSVDQDTTGDLNFQAGSVTPLSIKSTGLVSVSNTASFKLPVGGMASRPASPQNGMMRFNEDLNEVEAYAGNWQALSSSNLKLKLDFDETTTLDSRISFTRATNGTYFDSAGVLTTAGSGVARFDHRLESGVWVNKGLLIEEQRTNLCIRSQEFDLAFWEKQNTTVTSNTTTAPTNTTIAESLLETTTNSTHSITSASGASAINITSTSANPTSVSIFVKANGRDNIRFGFEQVASPFNQFFADINLTTQAVINTGNNGTSGVVLSTSIQDVGNGWRRVSVSGYTTVSSANHILRVYLRDASLNFSYTGDTSKGVFLFGAQVEQGAFPTSFINTTTTSATRNADVASMTSTNFSSWYNATEGTVFWQGDMGGVSGGNLFAGWEISNNTIAERLLLVTQNATGLISTLLVRDDNVDVGAIASPDPRITAVPNQVYKTASAYKLNDLAHTLDGRAPGTDTSVTMPTPNMLRLGTGNEAGTSVYFLNGHIAKFYYWNTRRPNEVLQNLTE